ncbi:MAG: hypothetical protein QG652_713 [Pseudomonadota bacterium]|nr:hypothetical protein [Pseudomonadota bacterium]
MHHIVINYQQRRQYLMFFIAAMIFSFGLGYWFGYHTNSTEDFSAALSQMDILRNRHGGAADNESPVRGWSSEIVPATEPDAVKSPGVTVVPEARPVVSPTVAAKPAVVAKPADKPVVPAVTVTPVAKLQPPVQSPSVATPVNAQAVRADTIPAVAGSSENITNTSLSAEAASTFYAVQAGVFDSRENAMKLVNELNTKGFDSYIAETSSTNGEPRFNVQFGRSGDRDQVQKRLIRFRQLYTTTAYVITLDN